MTDKKNSGNISGMVGTSQVQRRPLTRKQKEFVKQIILNPKESTTEIASRVYDVANRNVAGSIAVENMQKPAIVSELAKHSKEIEETIQDVARELIHTDKLEHKKEGLLNYRWMHDKIHGKATQKTEVTTNGVTINIDLSSSLQ